MNKRKILTLILAASMLLASCGKAPEETTEETSEETTITVEETTASTATPTPTPRPTATPSPRPTSTPTPTPRPTATPTPVPVAFEFEYVTDVYEDYLDISSAGNIYHVPQIDIESDDVSEINAEILSIMEGPIADCEANGRAHMYCSRYNVFVTEDNLMTVVFCLCGEWDDDEYYMWTVDINSGARLSNSEIAEAAGVSDIRGAAVDALGQFLNTYWGEPGSEREPDFINGELNPDGPNYGYYTSFDEVREEADATFSEERLNSDMCIGLDADSNLIFSSRAVSLGGATGYNRCYTSTGEYVEF